MHYLSIDFSRLFCSFVPGESKKVYTFGGRWDQKYASNIQKN